MEFFQLFTHLLAKVLVGYLALTNSLAGYIEHFIPTPQNTPVIVSRNEKSPLTTLEKIVRTSHRITESIPNILLEHNGFQRAAILASNQDELPFSLSPDKTLTENIEAILVNVFCQYKTDKYIRTTTGTGFFINPKGVILTNAHVAQFLLLEDMQNTSDDVTCVIRGGNPASPKYHAKLLYISPVWIFDNADLITDEAPRGTGERDYALLYVSESVDGTPLPARFPAIPVATDLLPHSIQGNALMTAGYPAESLIRGGADTKLYPVVEPTTLGSLYTFGSNYADIFSISESAVGEQGASGGPVIVPDAQNVIGLIVTKGNVETEGEHSLRALTLSYIDRTITEETGFSLIQNMQGDVALRGNIFKSAMVPFLAGILEEKLSENAQ